MFHIKELARRTGIDSPTIRYYEDVGVLPTPERAENGYRVYDEQDVERVHFVTRARQLNFSLDEITEIIGFREQGKPPCRYVLSQVDEKLADIEQRIQDLIQLRNDLHWIQKQASKLTFENDTEETCICHLIENSQLDKQET
jgi:DNA-binding transcriptional MerR regulator